MYLKRLGTYRNAGSYPYHLYNAVNQLSAYKKCKATLKSDEALVVVDFAENFTCREAVEVQSGYYCRNSVTIHPMVMMFKKGETCERDAVIAISPDLNYDATEVKTFLQYLDTHVSIHHPTIAHLIVWSEITYV